MATTTDLLTDGLERIKVGVHDVLDGLDEDALTLRIDADANTIAWLVWHLARIQDAQVCELSGAEQAWTANRWHGKFGLPFRVGATGYGQSSSEVAAVRGITTEQLAGYYDDVHAATLSYVQGLAEDDLDRVIDTRWDPPVTVGVRLVSVLEDDLQHVGQAAFVRGIAERR